MPFYLSKYFSAVGLKRLSQVEIDAHASNQHEFNGIGEFKRIFGTERKTIDAKFIFVNDENENASEDGHLTWYDARAGHITRTEYRLYYSSKEVVSQAKPGDLVVIALTVDERIAVVFARAESTAEQQILWLFGYTDVNEKFDVKDLSEHVQDAGFAGKVILSSLGFEIEETSDYYLDAILGAFGYNYPSTIEFNSFARSTVKECDPISNPDQTLMLWIEREELLFKTLEKQIIEVKLKEGFGSSGVDVDEFIKFSLSVQNRRKSRAGYSLEHNLAVIFSAHGIEFSRGPATERNNRPDFIFPGIEYYRDSLFPPESLTMLGVKTSVKDRWRQVLSEASKIKVKHLLTLEPAISRNQTEEMRINNVQLVIPTPLINTFAKDQQNYLIDLVNFISVVSDKQNRADIRRTLF